MNQKIKSLKKLILDSFLFLTFVASSCCDVCVSIECTAVQILHNWCRAAGVNVSGLHQTWSAPVSLNNQQQPPPLVYDVCVRTSVDRLTVVPTVCGLFIYIGTHI